MFPCKLAAIPPNLQLHQKYLKCCLKTPQKSYCVAINHLVHQHKKSFHTSTASWHCGNKMLKHFAQYLLQNLSSLEKLSVKWISSK